MNIKSLLEDTINLFHYLPPACLFYDYFMCVYVCVCHTHVLKLQCCIVRRVCVCVSLWK